MSASQGDKGCTEVFGEYGREMSSSWPGGEPAQDVFELGLEIGFLLEDQSATCIFGECCAVSCWGSGQVG